MQGGREGEREGRYVARHGLTLVSCVGEEQLAGEQEGEEEHSVVAHLA